MSRLHGVVMGAAAAAVWLSGHAALADTRIFTARASEPGVTIEQAFRNGQELGVVGRGEGTTLFRIDEPSTVVACANRFDFVTSTGEKINLAADLCVLDWEVVVKVAAAAVAPPPEETPPAEPAVPPAAEAPPPPEPEALPPAATTETPPLPSIPEVPGTPPVIPGETFKQIVTITLDQPGVTVKALTLDGAPVTISGYLGGAAQFEIEGSEQGIVCEHALGLTLSDGRTVTQQVNLCLNDWKVTVAVSGAAPAAPPTPGVTELVPAPAPPVAAPPVAPEAPLTWSFTAGEIAVALVHGQPETDYSPFVATCNKGSERITVTLFEATAPGLAPGAAVPVSFSAGGFSKSFTGTMGPVQEMSGASNPSVVISVADPLWPALIRETNVVVVAGPAYSATLSLKGSAAPVRQLLAACGKAAPPAPPPPPPPAAGGQGGGGQGITARYACESGQGFRVTFLGERGTAVLNEQGAPPLTLLWVPEGEMGRYVAGPSRLTIREDHVRWTRNGERARTCFPR